MAEAEYLSDRRRLSRALDALGPDEVVKEPNADALRLAATIGTAGAS